METTHKKKFCTKCGKVLPEDSNVCSSCGEETAAIKRCSDNWEKVVKVDGNQKHCKKCGSIIDNKTKVCTGCYKRYFKFNASFVLTICLICLFIALLMGYSYLDSELARVEDENYYLEEKCMFFEQRSVVVPNAYSKFYHSYDCDEVSGYDSIVYSLEQARQESLEPCSKCLSE